MKAAIMQPYLFPYLGYYQLANSVDTFVFFDDVNFIKRGYINRNNILFNGESFRFTLPLISASQNKLIKDIDCCDNNDKLLRTIKQAYTNAPYYREVIALVESVICSEERNLAYIASKSIKVVFDYLGLSKDFIYSSDIDYNRDVSGEEKIIDICMQLSVNKYINPIGGVELYNKDNFLSKGLDLDFIEKESILYKQNSDEFIDNLSIIDVLMWNSKEEVIELLKKYRNLSL